jgi:N-dimethylarginine dimethylaminohydrolase
MKLDFLPGPGGSDLRTRVLDTPQAWRVLGETDRLTDVMLCPPDHLAPVPCCSVTRQTLRDGVATSRRIAREQHRALETALTSRGVTCHVVEALADLPDLCFMRDAAVVTPWGLVALNPAMAHRAGEVDHVIRAAHELGAEPLERIRTGTVEGGDVCIVRPGLAIIGCSGERTDDAGAETLATIFRRHDWEVLIYRFDPHFLHLDTMFCMLDENTALACVDVLDDAFVAAIEARGIAIVAATYKESRGLGCNILSLDGRTIMMSAGNDRIAAQLHARGYETIAVDVSQFAACGGGIHCLTMPIARVPA